MMSQVGGARLDRGEFQVYMSEGRNKSFMKPGPLKEHIREYWDFLMGPEDVTTIGPREVRKGSSLKGLPMVSFQILGAWRIILYKKAEGFATIVIEQPFEAFATPAQEEEYAPTGGGGDDDDEGGGYDAGEE
jgi:hypothetical protein